MAFGWNPCLNKLYEHYVREHQQPLLDAAAAVVAVNGLFLILPDFVVVAG